MTTTITPVALPPYRQPVADVIAVLGGDATLGLGTAEAQARLGRYGRNELPAEPPVPAWRTFLAQFQDPLTVLLLKARSSRSSPGSSSARRRCPPRPFQTP